jgi:DNA-binding protein Fis
LRQLEVSHAHRKTVRVKFADHDKQGFRATVAVKSLKTDSHARILAEAEREILMQAITLAEGNQAKAARWLGLSRFTLREKLKQLGLHPDSTGANLETNG